MTDRSELSLIVELTDARRSLARVISLVTGRSFAVKNCSFDVAAGPPAVLLLTVEGPTRLRTNLVSRVKQLVDVLDVAVLSQRGETRTDDGLVLHRARFHTRIDGEAAISQVVLALSHREESCLAAGEGRDSVEALTRALTCGAKKLHPGFKVPLDVQVIGLSTEGGNTASAPSVRITMAASEGNRRWRASASAPDTSQAALDALLRLYADAFSRGNRSDFARVPPLREHAIPQRTADSLRS